MLNKSVLTFLVFFSMFSCGQNIRNKSLEYRIQDALNKEDKITFLKLDTVSQFEWDKLILLKPYSSIEHLEKKYNIDLTRINGKFQSYDEYLGVAFLLSNKCVSFVELKREFMLEDQEKVIYEKENSIIPIVM